MSGEIATSYAVELTPTAVFPAIYSDAARTLLGGGIAAEIGIITELADAFIGLIPCITCCVFFNLEFENLTI